MREPEGDAGPDHCGDAAEDRERADADAAEEELLRDRRGDRRDERIGGDGAGALGSPGVGQDALLLARIEVEQLRHREREDGDAGDDGERDEDPPDVEAVEPERVSRVAGQPCDPDRQADDHEVEEEVPDRRPVLVEGVSGVRVRRRDRGDEDERDLEAGDRRARRLRPRWA